MNHLTRPAILMYFAIASGLAWSQAAPASASDEKKLDPNEGFHVKPVVLDGRNSGGATVGLQYALQKTWAKNFDQIDKAGSTFNPDARLASLAAEIKGSGTVTANKERNPNKLLDIAANGYYLGSTSLATYGIGGSMKYESDQGFDDKQYVYGLTALVSKYGGIFPANDFGLLQIAYGRVNPKEDAGRKTALGTTALSSFNRFDAELYYRHQLTGALRGIEFQYRYFRELNAPVSVKAAGLDQFRLGTIRLNIMDDRFLAFSSGSLPFDRMKDRSITVGWTYKLD